MNRAIFITITALFFEEFRPANEFSEIQSSYGFFGILVAEFAACSKPQTRDNHRESVLSKYAKTWPGWGLNPYHAIRIVVNPTSLPSRLRSRFSLTKKVVLSMKIKGFNMRYRIQTAIQWQAFECGLLILRYWNQFTFYNFFTFRNDAIFPLAKFIYRVYWFENFNLRSHSYVLEKFICCRRR